MNKHPFWKLGWQKGDLAVCALIIFAALVLFFTSWKPAGFGRARVCVIMVDGVVVRRESLGAAKTFTVKGVMGPATIVIAEGQVCLTAAPCPDKFCIKQGWISRPGQVLVCVPNRLLVQVEAQAGNRLYDTILR